MMREYSSKESLLTSQDDFSSEVEQVSNTLPLARGRSCSNSVCARILLSALLLSSVASNAVLWFRDAKSCPLVPKSGSQFSEKHRFYYTRLTNGTLQVA